MFPIVIYGTAWIAESEGKVVQTSWVQEHQHEHNR